MRHVHISDLHDLFLRESQPFRKVHRLIDLFESIIKMHTVVILSEYVKHNKLSDTAKGMLAQGLRTPSLGSWQLFSRVLFEELQADHCQWLLPEFVTAFAELDKALNAEKTNVIAFRNGYAHGATPGDQQCEADIKKFEPFLNQLMQSIWLQNSALEVREGRVYLTCSLGERCLHPLLVYREENAEASFAFFNDLKNDKVGLINYPLSKLYREKDFYREFHDFLPLQEWKKSGNNEFSQRIDELTESFKGRNKERRQLIDFVINQNKGFFSILGNPGIGKSALIARFFKDIQANKEISNVQVVEYFIRRGTQQAQVECLFNYLIRKTDEIFPAGKEIHSEGKLIWDLQNQLFSKWRRWGVESQGRKLLFLIDGLDEAVENDIVTYLPRENFEQVLFIYGSRIGGHPSLEALWSQLPVENHIKIELSGLSREDIRAMIYEVSNKYELERESAWIDAVQQRSEGNPLYLKLLCDAIANGSIALNDINGLPEKIEEYYKAILDRYARNTSDGDALLNGLYVFAAAKDYLTLSQVGLINKLSEATLQRIGSTLKEILYENPLTEDVLDYQLFHESFREYLIKQKPRQVADAAYRLIDFCRNWKDYQGSWEQRYALEYYAVHLSESQKEEHSDLLINLIHDHSYIEEQKKVLRSFDASNHLLRLALSRACEKEREENVLEAALSLIDLKYEEANDAPRIVEMVSRGEIDMALKRIIRFGQDDEEGLRYRFLLYMLCLMELTLLVPPKTDFRREAIQKLLLNMDENMAEHYGSVIFDDMIPGYLMFRILAVLSEMGLDYSRLISSGKNWDLVWIKEKGPYSEYEYEVLSELLNQAPSNDKIRSGIAIAYAKDRMIDVAVTLISEINDLKIKIITKVHFAEELYKYSINEKACDSLYEAFILCSELDDEFDKNTGLKAIAFQFSKQQKYDEAIRVAAKIDDTLFQCKALMEIAGICYEHGDISEYHTILTNASELANSIEEPSTRAKILTIAGFKLLNSNSSERALYYAETAYSAANLTSNKYSRSSALIEVAGLFFDLGLVEKAKSILQEANNSIYLVEELNEKCWALNELGNRFISLELYDMASVSFKEANKLMMLIDDPWFRVVFQQDIYTGLIRCGRAKESYELIGELSTEHEQEYAAKILIDFYVAKGDISKVLEIIDIYSVRLNRNSFFNRDEVYSLLANYLFAQGKPSEAKSILIKNIQQQKINLNKKIKHATVIDFTKHLLKTSQYRKAINLIGLIDDLPIKLKALLLVIDSCLKDTDSLVLSKMIEDVLERTGDCPAGESKHESLSQLAVLYYRLGLKQKSLELVNQSLTETKYQRSDFFRDFSCTEVFLCCSEILSEDQIGALTVDIPPPIRAIPYVFLSKRYHSENKLNKSEEYLSNAMECARSADGWWKFCLLLIICDIIKEQKGVEDRRRLLDEIYGSLEKVELVESGFDLALLNYLFKLIAKGYADIGAWHHALLCSKQLSDVDEMKECWNAVAEQLLESNDLQKVIATVGNLADRESRLLYLQGITESVDLFDVNGAMFLKMVSLVDCDLICLQNIIIKYALNSILLKPSLAHIDQRLVEHMNLQWAVELADRFNEKPLTQRLSTNLDVWLNQITDEDDMEQIKLWAKQVSKGKISEDEFGKRLSDLIG